jgi:hypothetical protein
LATALGLAPPEGLTRNLRGKVGALEFGNPDGYEARLKAEGEALLLEALAEGTSKTYRAAWEQWLTYARVRGRHPFFDGQTRPEIRQDEEEILLYVVHLGVTMSRAAGTVKAKLFALRQMHIMSGYPDPLLNKPRLWMAIKGLERRRGPARRKLPTTPGMLRWIRTQLRPESRPNDAVLWCGLMLAFFYLMRVGEYAHSGHWDRQKVLTPSDLKGQAGGCAVAHYKEADELLLRFKSSKADQEGAGATRNHYRTHEELCPVEAVELLEKHLGHRMRNEPHEPLLRWEDGTPLTREHIQAILERSAVACDLPADRFRSHSLRIGGATALYHIYHDVEIIKRYGRWTSGAFQGYLWDANETAQGVAAKMARDNTTIHVDRPSPTDHASASARAREARARKVGRETPYLISILERRLNDAPRCTPPRHVASMQPRDDHMDLAYGRRSARGRGRQPRAPGGGRGRQPRAPGTSRSRAPRPRPFTQRAIIFLRHDLVRAGIPHSHGWADVGAVVRALETTRMALMMAVEEDPERFAYDARRDYIRAKAKRSYVESESGGSLDPGRDAELRSARPSRSAAPSRATGRTTSAQATARTSTPTPTQSAGYRAHAGRSRTPHGSVGRTPVFRALADESGRRSRSPQFRSLADVPDVTGRRGERGHHGVFESSSASRAAQPPSEAPTRGRGRRRDPDHPILNFFARD